MARQNVSLDDLSNQTKHTCHLLCYLDFCFTNRKDSFALLNLTIEMRFFFFFFFFFSCPHKRGEKIRTSDLYFIRRNPQLIELSLWNNKALVFVCLIKKEKKVA
jgi:hypothetical protein